MDKYIKVSKNNSDLKTPSLFLQVKDCSPALPQLVHQVSDLLRQVLVLSPDPLPRLGDLAPAHLQSAHLRTVVPTLLVGGVQLGLQVSGLERNMLHLEHVERVLEPTLVSHSDTTEAKFCPLFSLITTEALSRSNSEDCGSNLEMKQIFIDC